MNYKKIENSIGYTFKNKNHLKVSLTHSSFAYENNLQSYEVYEFLGDALIDFFVSAFLVSHFDFAEGQLTKLRASLVNARSLKKVVEGLGIEKEILVSKSLSSKLPNSVMADVFESLTAAIYLDGGLAPAKRFVSKFLLKNLENKKDRKLLVVDYKSMLQEKMQAENKKLAYRVVKKWGEPNSMTFCVALFINNKKVAQASEKSIKAAEQKCALIYWRQLEKSSN